MEKLIPNQSYHIFNHANGFENIFGEDKNYQYFLEKYSEYICPIAETYAYCLMPNHFHLVVRIRKREVIEAAIRRKQLFSKVSFDFGKDGGEDEVKIENNEIEKFLSKQFSNLFSCYTQSFNKTYKRMGSLFIKNFKREAILEKEYFLNAIVYTHRNPIHHGFCTQFTDWGYSSYSEINEQKSNIIEFTKLLKVFDGHSNFIDFHKQYLDKFNQSTELEAPI
jgi:REP element-mobilizing transposase RayT